MRAVMAADHPGNTLDHLVIAFQRCENLLGNGLIIRMAFIAVILRLGNLAMRMFGFVE